MGEGSSPKFQQLSPKFENADEREKTESDLPSPKKVFGG